jgi:uncharacterized protein (TIGR02246 family)
MHTTIIRWLTLSLMSIALCACAAPAERAGDATAPAVDARAPVAAATDAWRSAYDSRDPARIVAMYDTEAVLWGTTAKTLASTPAAIADYFKDAANRPTARVAFGEQVIRVFGDSAVNTGYYTFSEVRDGKTVARPARFTLVFRKHDGTWRIVAHHSSVVP